MPDPIITGYLAEVAADLWTVKILDVVGNRLRQTIALTPRQQALERCYQAALAALVPDDDLHQALYQPLLEAFISDPAVIAELAKLVRGRTPDLDTLVDSFAEVTAGHTLPPMDVTARLAASVEAFVQVAEQESALATIMQTAHLREATQSLRAMARDVQAIRQAVDLATSRTGDVTATGDITAHNLVTGTQTIHIVNVYQAGGGTWGEAEYQAALERYLAWLAATNGRVVLRGIQRSGQQAVELSLQDVYVPLAATPLPTARDRLKGQLERRASRRAASRMEAAAELGLSAAPPERITMQDLLHQGERLVLIGAPGCGKTTVLQHIAWTLAEALRTHQPYLATARLGLSGALPLPIYVPLSLYADHRRQFATDPDPHRRQLATFINHYLVERQAGLHLPEDFFATLLDQGQHVLLLLDGLDEVPNEDERALVSQAVRDLTHGRPQARLVVTSRTQAYQGKAVLGDEFRVVQVLPLDPEHVDTLIHLAYRAIYPTEVERDTRERQATDLVAGVTKLEAERAARLGATDEQSADHHPTAGAHAAHCAF